MMLKTILTLSVEEKVEYKEISETAKRRFLGGIPERASANCRKMLSTAGENDARLTVSTLGHPSTLVIREQSLIGEMKGTQTPAVDNMPLQTVTGQESPSPPAVEESVTQTYAEDNKSLQSLTGKEPPTVPVEEKDYQEKSLTDEGHQPGVSFPETLQDAKEESTPMTIATPALHCETIAGEESCW